MPENTQTNYSEVIRTATQSITNGECTCVVLTQDNQTLHRSGIGVKPLIQLYENEPDTLTNACVVDKIIGKAAAMLLTLAGVSHIHALTMSKSAIAFLQSVGVSASYDNLVDTIHNRTNTGTCPLESCVLELTDTAQAYTAIKDTIAILMSQAQATS